MTIFYEDERVICDDEGISIKGYYKPIEDTDKKILYSQINSIKQQKLNLLAGLSQIWGKANDMLRGNTDTRPYWSSLDFKRIFKSKAIVIDEGNFTKSVITPENVDKVFKILRQKSLKARH